MKLVFLDRDGVINRDPGDAQYVTGWKSFRFLPHVKKAIAFLKRHGFKIFVISNQAGVGKGVYSQDALDHITYNMVSALVKSEGDIDGIYYCVHSPEDNCDCRKPKPGLFKKFRRDTGIDYSRSFYVGDTMRDIKTAQAAGLRSILVLSGKEKLKNRGNWDARPDFVFKNLYEAAKFIVETPEPANP